MFWLVEELLDSQTIAGCRKIFDFLESRREVIIAKNFKHKQLVVLRSCNELLRRLSRAEDTAFCGRVFIFLFQSFPLGDKSSVNLRGEYHVENVTTFDDLQADLQAELQSDPKTDPKVASQVEDGAEKMDIDTTAVSNGKNAADPKAASRAVPSDAKKPAGPDQPLEPDTLYPLFWSLQECFNQPKKLFDKDQLARFKEGLEATMTTFRVIQNEQGGRPSKSMEDTKRGVKRKKLDSEGDDISNAFNPKYLTSRDLFELEVSRPLFLNSQLQTDAS